jgi:hypothetical protein
LPLFSVLLTAPSELRCNLLKCRCGHCGCVGHRRTVCIRSLDWLTWYLLLPVHQAKGAFISPIAAGQICTTWPGWGCCCCYGTTPGREVLGWCGWKRTSFPLELWALSATFSYAFLPWRACSLDSWSDEAPLHPSTCSSSKSVSMWHCPFPGTPCAGDRPALHIQRGCCLPLAVTWPNFWQL